MKNQFFLQVFVKFLTKKKVIVFVLRAKVKKIRKTKHVVKKKFQKKGKKNLKKKKKNLKKSQLEVSRKEKESLRPRKRHKIKAINDASKKRHAIET